MLSLEELGYFLYMEQCEKEEEQEKVNVKSNYDLVAEQGRQDRKKEKN